MPTSFVPTAGTLGMLMLAMQPGFAASHGGPVPEPLSPGLMLPQMDAVRGGQLFASKGCVVCHSVNGVGGEDAPPLDAATMPRPMNPFAFAARMWGGAEAMVFLQREELGEPIDLTGQELADITAFAHDEAAQAAFSAEDIPARIRDLMEHTAEGADAHGETEPE